MQQQPLDYRPVGTHQRPGLTPDAKARLTAFVLSATAIVITIVVLIYRLRHLSFMAN